MSEMILGAFQMFGSPSARGVTAWQHPRSDITRFHEIDHWVEVARLLDDSGFDFLFFADSWGYPTADGVIVDAAAKYGINFPLLDPQLLIPVLAYATNRLGFVVTETTGIHHPVETARRFATLDHLTEGRLGMNVVTGAIQNVVADLFGHGEMRQHDDRYDRADEYLRLARDYLENSWDSEALVDDAESATYADAAHLHKIEHNGTYYRSAGYFSVDPSPQRTPVIFQAGTSGRGKDFAASNAECVLLQGSTLELTAANVADIRARAVESGRDPQSIRMLVTISITVAPTREEAVALRAEFDALQTEEVTAAMFASNTGIDLLSLDPALPLSQIAENGVVGQIGQSNIDRFTPADGPAPSVREILDQLRGRGLRGFQLVGDAIEIADELEHILAVTGLDGFMLDPLFGTADIEDFSTLVMPELRRRGRLSQPASAGTLRERLFADRSAGAEAAAGAFASIGEEHA